MTTQMECYEESRVKPTTENGEDVTAHIFEHTITATYTNDRKTEVEVKLHIIFCLKEQKKDKLNSHRWFFNAFCPLVMPEGKMNHYPQLGPSYMTCHNISPVCILLDVGTKLADTAIYELWKCTWLLSPTDGTAEGIFNQVLRNTLASEEHVESTYLYQV
jgi:chitin synthase